VKKGEQCKGGTMSKEQLTIFICSDMAGNLEQPLVIGKAAKPICFCNLNVRTLPVLWQSNKKAWMTCMLMEEWLHAFNSRIKAANRNVLLFLDNAACHPHLKLSNIKLVWFPANTMAIMQPMDQGVIGAFKV